MRRTSWLHGRHQDRPRHQRLKSSARSIDSDFRTFAPNSFNKMKISSTFAAILRIDVEHPDGTNAYRIPADPAQIAVAGDHLRLAGVSEIFEVSAVNGEGIETLVDRLS